MLNGIYKALQAAVGFFYLFLHRCQTINTVLSAARVQHQNKS